VNWLADAQASNCVHCVAKIRYRHTPAPATVTSLAGEGARVDFQEPQSAITPGQAVVFYEGDRVLGGGWIEQAIPLQGDRLGSIVSCASNRI
jgi:tRNA-specific 2-thiouridylase